MSRRIVVLVILTFALLVSVTSPVFAAESSGVEQATKSIVSVGVVFPDDYTQAGKNVGSGVVVADGWVVTDFTVVATLYYAQAQLQAQGIQFDAYVFDGESKRPYVIQAVDEASGLALLRVRGLTSPPIAWGDGGKVQSGDPVFVIGYPLGMNKVSANDGIVSQPKQTVASRTYIGTSAGISEGDQGGALVDAEGLLIGVVKGALSGEKVENMGFAIPSGDVRGFLQDAAPAELKKKLEVAMTPQTKITTKVDTSPVVVTPNVTTEKKTTDWTPIIIGVVGVVFVIVVILVIVLLMRKPKTAPAPAPMMVPPAAPPVLPQPQPQAGTMVSSAASNATMISPGADSVALTLKAGGSERTLTVALPAVAGRAPEAEIRVDDGEVSRRHLELSRVNGELTVRDLGSRNGTRLNGGTVGSAPVKPGDRIQFGASEIVIQ
jgi:hypothetical protein